MPSRTSTWALEVAGVFAKEWRTELRTRYALNTLGLFGFTTLVVVAAALGPLGVSAARSNSVLPVLLWIILLFAGAAGLPRSFVVEEETGTALALRLAAPPSVLFAGKVVYGVTLTWALEALIAPLFLAVMDLKVKTPGLFAGTLAAGGYGLAAGSTLVAAIIAQARGKGTLFAVLAFPVLLPLLLLAVELTRAAVAGDAAGVALPQLMLYDASVTIAGLMLFPTVWNP